MSIDRIAEKNSRKVDLQATADYVRDLLRKAVEVDSPAIILTIAACYDALTQLILINPPETRADKRQVQTQLPLLTSRSDSTYSVIQGRNEMELIELREGANQPFRCPQTIYSKTASCLAGIGDTDILFEDILANVRKQLKDPRLPDYQVRVCLRFWRRQSPPLLKRISGRYKPAVKRFLSATDSAWEAAIQG
ncbi:MAG TPA: hypothetical protein VFE58_13170 [Tepidisphaeraceae bacterium]|jgi:hypothetical protein|nr:hypothetical protein [Tepidisphaeraceae bacterium]